MRTVALDLGARRVDFCEITEGGVIERGVLAGLSQLQTRLGPASPAARVAFEACREGWYVAQRLSGWGHEPVMVDTTRVKQLGIGQHGRKNDRIDAEVLATALISGRIPQAHILSPARQKLRMELSVRRSLVATRAQYVTSIRGIVRARGGCIAECRTCDFLDKLQEVALDQQAQQLIEPLRASLEVLTRQIAEMDLRIEQLCGQEPVIRRLMTVPCVGSMVAASFVSVIDEAGRFRNAHQVESYLGLVPSEDSTGGRRRLGAISKAGNPYLRALLVEASWTLLRKKDGDPLTRWGRQIARRRGQRIAVVALARRLAGVLWAIWRDEAVYDPQRVGLKSAEGVLRHAQEREFQAQALRAAADKAAKRIRSARRTLESRQRDSQ
jgi:transposase